MTESSVNLIVDESPLRAREGDSLAAALLNAGVWDLRRSVEGAPRGPLCGMGICYECRVTVDGVAHRRACLLRVADGMVVQTAPRRVRGG
jgi:predicted molibdopterin-dependent oxidoreductase YjgC